MTCFSTEFPINSKNTVKSVIQLVCTWITGSPHTKIHEKELPSLPVNGENTVKIDGDVITLAHAKSDDFEMGGVRYVRIEKNLQWTTSIVTIKNEVRHSLSIQVVCEAMNTATRLPPPKKPYFVRQALEKLGGGTDGEIPVADQPFRLKEGEEQVASALILGTANNALPIIYVSADLHGNHQINPDELAKLVCGMAHVVVEPSRKFSFKVRGLVGSKNVYGGAVGVYWPNSQARSTYINNDAPNSRSLQLEVAKTIRVALSNRRQVTPCTWLNLKEVMARNRIEQLKSAGSTKLEEYIKAFDSELEAKDIRLNEAEDELARLTAEVSRLSAMPSSIVTSGLIQRGNEQDLYQNEVTDIIILALSEAGSAIQYDNRRKHVIHDLLEKNQISGEGERLKQQVKDILKNYQSMDNKTRQSLLRLGFSLSDTGKHYKAVFQGDERYKFTISKTSSDHRAGKNLASDINKKLF